MRIAVALPSLSRGSIARRQTDAVIAALAARHDVETFAESTRLNDGDGPGGSVHYLRFSERHRERPFETALYALGRDYRPYEPAYLLCRRFPGVVWALEAVLHHMYVGGLAVRGRWDAYVDSLEAVFPEHARRLAATVAAGWGTRATYDRFDPVPATVANRHVIAASTEAIADQLRRRGASATVVPLPRDAQILGARAERASTDLDTITVLSSSPSWPGPLLRGLRTVLDSHDGVKVRFCTHEILYEPVVMPAAVREGVQERIDWELSPSPARQRALVDEADLVVAASSEALLEETGLVLRAMAAGTPCAILATPSWDAFPADAVVRLEPGRGTGPALAATVAALRADRNLATALRRRGRAWAIGGIAADVVVDRLEPLLDEAAGRGPREETQSAAAWAELAERIERHCLPSGCSPGAAQLMRGRWNGTLPPALAAPRLPADGAGVADGPAAEA